MTKYQQIEALNMTLVVGNGFSFGKLHGTIKAIQSIGTGWVRVFAQPSGPGEPFVVDTAFTAGEVVDVEAE